MTPAFNTRKGLAKAAEEANFLLDRGISPFSTARRTRDFSLIEYHTALARNPRNPANTGRVHLAHAPSRDGLVASVHSDFSAGPPNPTLRHEHSDAVLARHLKRDHLPAEQRSNDLLPENATLHRPPSSSSTFGRTLRGFPSQTSIQTTHTVIIPPNRQQRLIRILPQ